MISSMSALVRKGVWFVKGLSEYTSSGFLKAARRFNPDDLEETISNRFYMITGANSGIGKCTVQNLASRGATVYMVCRDPGRGETARQEIIEKTGSEKVELHILDLSKPRDVTKFAQDFVSSGKSLDTLVNNAAVLTSERTMNDDGMELSFCVNTLGTYILTTRLIPTLEKCSNPQVVTVSSGGMLLMKLDPNDLQFENQNDDTFSYAAQNKRQQVVMTKKWAEKYPNIHFSSMHPGWADTPAVQTSMPYFHRMMGGWLRSPEEGADTIVWLCSSSAARRIASGSFFQDRCVVDEHLSFAQTHSSSEDEQLLMTRLEELSLNNSVSPPSHLPQCGGTNYTAP